MAINRDELVERAFLSYSRENLGMNPQPCGDSGVVEHKGRLYVELHNGGGTLAIYRICNDGRLKKLQRWPKAIAWSCP
jgi:hypothetical protein